MNNGYKVHYNPIPNPTQYNPKPIEYVPIIMWKRDDKLFNLIQNNFDDILQQQRIYQVFLLLLQFCFQMIFVYRL